MAGHSKWHTTRHKKAALDAKRAKMYATHIKAIEVAARAGGADIDGNPALDVAVTKAKKQSVPNDNIERAIKRGAGLTGEVIDYDEIMYEVRGPEGSALLVECLTDNRNRAASEVRATVTRNGGFMADPGSVSFMFERRGVVRVPAEGHEEDDIMMAVIDAGAEEIIRSGTAFEIISEPSAVQEISRALDEAEIHYESDDVEFFAEMKVELDAKAAQKFIQLWDAIEELDDVQNVYSNVEISAEVLDELASQDA
ncbi:MAG TPA: YebC/PmpR family DNA-binding transcriptional regulator [Enteractinococcus sp.]